MSESTENLNSSMSSGSESQKSSSAGDAVKKLKSDINHSSSNSTSHKNNSSSGSPLKKPSSNSHHSNSVSKSKDHHNGKPKDPNAIKKSHHDSSKLKDGSPKPRPKDGSHSSPKPSSHSSSSKPKDGSNSSSKPKDGSQHSSSKPRPHSSSSSSSKPKSGSNSSSSSKPKEGSSSSSSKPKEGSSSSSSKPKDGSHHSSSSKPSSHSSSSSKPGSHSSSKPKEGSHSSSKHSSSSKPKEGSQGTPKVKSSSDSSKPKVSSSGDASKHKSSSSSHKDGSSKPKEGSSKPSSSSSSSKHGHSSSSSSSKDKPKSDGIKKEEGDKVKVKAEPGSESKHTSSSSIVKSEHKVKDEPGSPMKVKKESEPEEKPKTEKSVKKRPLEDDDDDDYEPDFKVEKKQKVEDRKVKEESKKRKVEVEESDDDEPLVKKKKAKKEKKDKKKDKGEEEKGKKKKKKKAEEEEVWKWWEEEPLPDGMKWRTMEHKGPMFAPPYEPLPASVHFKYDGHKMKLSEGAEEVAGFYARMLDHDYTTKEVFNRNFFNDWRKEMTSEEQKKITKLEKCNFKQIGQYYKDQSELRKNRTKEQKQKLKKENEEIAAEYGFCLMDGHKEKIGNFRIEPPGLFRGRGEHPKMGKLKKRVRPQDVIINCAKDAKVPPPPDGTRWKKVIHDNKVSWLSTWTENVQGQNKYVMLNPSSRIKGEKDWQKYETARKLKKIIGKIRDNYREDCKSKEMRVRQRAVAMYFIDKLALRAGNEKDGEEEADTVGCCSLRVEHLKLFEEKDGKEFVVEFDFLGKDSIRYFNSVPVEKRVFKNLKLFVEKKEPGDDLFDRLNTSILNQHLRDLMDNLTAKVFRTYNASFTLQNQLNELTNPEDSIPSKELSYNRANRAVAILCNHQRAAPKTFDKQMSNLQEKITKKHEDIKKAKKEYKALKSDYKSSRSEKTRTALERKKKQVDRLEEQLMKLDVSKTDKQENKEIALGTSKLNYLDPRISVAWTKKFDVPIEKVYNKTQREKFRWALDMAGAEFVF